MFGLDLDPEAGKFLATLGVGGVLAAFMFLFYRRDVKTYTDLWRGQSEQLTQVVKENTAAITRNTVIIEALHRRDDRIEDILVLQGNETLPHRRRSPRDGPLGGSEP